VGFGQSAGMHIHDALLNALSGAHWSDEDQS